MPDNIVVTDIVDEATGDRGRGCIIEMGSFHDDLEIVMNFEASSIGESEDLGFIEEGVEVLNDLGLQG